MICMLTRESARIVLEEMGDYVDQLKQFYMAAQHHVNEAKARYEKL